MNEFQFPTNTRLEAFIKQSLYSTDNLPRNIQIQVPNSIYHSKKKEIKKTMGLFGLAYLSLSTGISCETVWENFYK